jgi:hypothetical protein
MIRPMRWSVGGWANPPSVHRGVAHPEPGTDRQAPLTELLSPTGSLPGSDHRPVQDGWHLP